MGFFDAVGGLLGGATKWVGDIISPIGSALPFVGGVFDSISGSSSANDAIKHQINAAQNSIQWKVADAKKAGIHPLAALGAPMANINPQVVGSSMGQNIGEALYRMMDGPQRTMQQLEVIKRSKENDLLQSQIDLNRKALNGPPNGPGLPGAIDPRNAADPNEPGLTKDSIPGKSVISDLYGRKKIRTSEIVGQINESSGMFDRVLDSIERGYFYANQNSAWAAPFVPGARNDRERLYAIQDALWSRYGVWYVYKPKWDTWYLFAKKVVPSRLYFTQLPWHTKYVAKERK